MLLLTVYTRLDIGTLAGALGSVSGLHDGGELVADVSFEGDVLVAGSLSGVDNKGVPIV